MNCLLKCCFKRKQPLIYREIRIGNYINKEYQKIQNKFSSNTVITSKYNLLTFLPRYLNIFHSLYSSVTLFSLLLL